MVFSRREREVRYSSWRRQPVILRLHPCFLALHRREKLGVGLGLLESLEYDFHLLDW